MSYKTKVIGRVVAVSKIYQICIQSRYSFGIGYMQVIFQQTNISQNIGPFKTFQDPLYFKWPLLSIKFSFTKLKALKH